jgi:hypothetical protein
MSRAWHHESDGHTHVDNKVVETTIRAHVHNMQTNWSELLCMVEFAINNSKHSSTKYTPFFTVYWRHPLTPFARTVLPLKDLGLDMPGVEFLSSQMEEVWANALQNLKEARDRLKSYADAGRK